MSKVSSIHEVINNNLCISCGACVVGKNHKRNYMTESKSKGIFIPIIEEKDELYKSNSSSFKVCPGRGYEIESTSKELFPDATNENIELGRWISFCYTNERSSDPR